jgi:deoxyribonuclease-4
MIIGSHLSIAKGFYKAGQEALDIGANTFQFFTRNPRGGKAKDLDFSDINKLEDVMNENDFGKLLAHGPYTLNMASATEKTREFAKMCFREDLDRLNHIPCDLYNFHPGSHVGQGTDKGIELITDIINSSLREDHNTFVLLEAMSGKGTEIGRSFEELRTIIDEINLKDKVGVCIDTCHIYSAGYDIVNNLEGVLEEFDKTVGISRLMAIHLNDSKMPFNSNKDRHEKIGKGTIGLDAIVNFISNKHIKDLPIFLETPNELAGYKAEIDMLRQLVK